MPSSFGENVSGDETPGCVNESADISIWQAIRLRGFPGGMGRVPDPTDGGGGWPRGGTRADTPGLTGDGLTGDGGSRAGNSSSLGGGGGDPKLKPILRIGLPKVVPQTSQKHAGRRCENSLGG